MAAAAAAGAASAELVIGWCIFGLLLLVGEALGVTRGLAGVRGRPRRWQPGPRLPRPASPAPAAAAKAPGGGGPREGRAGGRLRAPGGPRGAASAPDSGLNRGPCARGSGAPRGRAPEAGSSRLRAGTASSAREPAVRSERLHRVPAFRAVGSAAFSPPLYGTALVTCVLTPAFAFLPGL